MEGMCPFAPIFLPLLFTTLATQTPDRTEVGTTLLANVAEIAGKLGEAGTMARLVRIAISAADELPVGSTVGQDLRALADAGVGERGWRDGDAGRLARELIAVADDLRFEPLREAPNPEAWPAFTPVGEIEVKTYPAYRMVRSPMSGANSMSAFWKLFEHIQTKSIPMTAPVQVDYRAEKDDYPTPGSMAFLYEHATKGSPGVDGRVEVVDVAAVTVISIGARGGDSRLRIEQLRERLEDWLHANRGAYRVAGPMRTMGWNSPSVRGDRRYFEVQIPVVPSL